MENSVGVRFKTAGKIYDFGCGTFILQTGDHVIVETENGMEFGTVATPPKEIEKKEGAPPLKRVFRQATEADCDQMKKMPTSKKVHSIFAGNAYGKCNWA